MKIIQADNFDREIIGVSNDQIVAENISATVQANIMCEALNEKLSSEYAAYYFKVVEDDYTLRIYEP